MRFLHGLMWWMAIGSCPLLAAEDAPSKKLAADAYAILHRACLECHGPLKQDGSLRLDSREAILKGGESGTAVDTTAIDASELLRRISLPKGDAEVMPKRGAVLSRRDVQLLRKWIAAGLPWSDEATHQPHWAYVAPQRRALSADTLVETPHPIDALVSEKLREEGLAFSPDAPLPILARRLFLDIIGLPPTPAEVDQFMAEAESNLPLAIDALVDRLLVRPQYGEKWARPWLDAARYADSHGFQRDDLHEIWAYRDWVIQSLNRDMPFDQFTIEQLAGDLLPNPTESQLIATGFNRCAPCNVEAGTDPEENRYNQVVDRVNTLGYVWLGTTLECAQCHDHKYDPFTRRDYYGLFAFFNQSEIEAERANPSTPGSIRFIGPYMNLSQPEEDPAEIATEKKIEALQARIARETKRESSSASSSVGANGVTHRLMPLEFESSGGAGHEVLDDGSILLHDDPPETDTYTLTVAIGETKPKGLVFEGLTHPSLPGTGPGRGDEKRSNFVVNTIEVFPWKDGEKGNEAIPVVDPRADFSQTGFDVANAFDKDDKSAWAIAPQFRKPHWAAVRFADDQSLEGCDRIVVRIVQNYGGARTIGRLRVSAIEDDYEAAIAKLSNESPVLAQLRKQLSNLEAKRGEKTVAKTLVMKELSQPRMSTMYERGDFRSPGQAIEPSTPTTLHPFREEGPLNRLSLAKWLVSKENPLVARVMVNRMWNELFGLGLVATPEDFGIKGEPPSHPALLDWLAVEFMENGWSQKELLKTIVTSRTYRQASRITPELQEKDPTNVFLARGPRFRLSAESIRDNALAIAGRLSVKQFGPPIRPPQPDGLWTKVGGARYDYQVSPGEDQYRRGIYVVIKRMSPYPSFINFDATARLACRVNRSRSNTPLQALTLLNDPVYVDAAQGLAGRTLREKPDGTLEEQLSHAFRLGVARYPSSTEMGALRQLFEDERTAMQASGATNPDQEAWFSIASTILNLDETITKE